MLGAHLVSASAALLALDLTDTQANILTISVLVIAVCIAAITFGLLGAAIAVLRMKSRAENAIADQLRKAQPAIAAVRARVEPLVDNTGAIMQDLRPKLKSITDDVAELSHMVRAQATDLDSTLSDVTMKARSQVDRVNGMVNATLDSTTNVVNSLERGIRVPIREASGLLAGLKAGFDVLISRDSYPAGRSTAVSPEITRQVDREARQAQAVADQRAREGRAADTRVHSAPNSSMRDVVDAGEKP